VDRLQRQGSRQAGQRSRWQSDRYKWSFAVIIVIQWDMEDFLTCAEAVMSFLQALGEVSRCRWSRFPWAGPAPVKRYRFIPALKIQGS